MTNEVSERSIPDKSNTNKSGARSTIKSNKTPNAAAVDDYYK